MRNNSFDCLYGKRFEGKRFWLKVGERKSWIGLKKKKKISGNVKKSVDFRETLQIKR